MALRDRLRERRQPGKGGDTIHPAALHDGWICDCQERVNSRVEVSDVTNYTSTFP